MTLDSAGDTDYFDALMGSPFLEPELPCSANATSGSKPEDIPASAPSIASFAVNRDPSPFDVDCSGCGVSGDGNDMDASETIECDSCKKWSHVQCMQHPSLMPTADSDDWTCPGCRKIVVWDDAKYVPHPFGTIDINGL